jgi:hypothetical protein
MVLWDFKIKLPPTVFIFFKVNVVLYVSLETLFLPFKLATRTPGDMRIDPLYMYSNNSRDCYCGDYDYD